MVMGGCLRKKGNTGGHGWVFEEERKHWWSWVGVVRRKGSTGGYG